MPDLTVPKVHVHTGPYRFQHKMVFNENLCLVTKLLSCIQVLNAMFSHEGNMFIKIINYAIFLCSLYS